MLNYSIIFCIFVIMAGAPKENKNAEKWGIHEDFPNYLVSIDGEIFSKISNKLMKLHPDGHGYLRTDLRGVKGVKTMKAHRLVGMIFLNNPKGLQCINHKDGNKLNNNKSNLEWCTPSHNVIHAYDTNLNQHGEKHSNSKLTNKQAREIIEKRLSGLKMRELSEIYNVSTTTIYRVINKQRYLRI